MKITLRKLIFWPHLIAGVITGLVIAVMSITGVVLAFEHQILEWADEARRVQAPRPDAARLPLDQLVENAKKAKPDKELSGVTVHSDPALAVLVSTGRGNGVYVDPWSGEVREQGAPGLRAFFSTMVQWHRWLGASGEHRAIGKAITGASNAVFLCLALTGIYLWWPRAWTWAATRSTLWFRGGVRGKARDFNWHNVIGFWTLPVIVVLTVSGVVISYRWASNLVFTLSGSEPPPARSGPPRPPTLPVEAPHPDATPLSLDALFARASEASGPRWESLTLGLGGGGSQKGPVAQSFTVREADAWPPFASNQVALHPFTGEVIRHERFSDGTPGRKARSWLRFLHTGEALGWPGQLVAAIASLGGAVLVWTGFALAWRRFTSWRRTQNLAGGASRDLPDGSGRG
ncbi:MAG: PepSY-associated TM helix domain-containing protein [Myxococcaceae bacterium]